MTAREVTIVGAGIGGLTAALALSRPERRITVIERRTGFGESGAGIQLSPNASRILIRLGLGASLRRVATEPDRIAIRDLRSGREIGAVALGAHANERYGAPYWLLARSDLHTVLLDAVRSRPEIRLRVGRSLEGLTQDGERVRFTARTGGGETEAGETELLVGADGIRSRVRSALGDRRAPVRSGFVAYRTTIAAGAGAARQAPVLWLGPGRHVVQYPIDGGRQVNVVAVARGERTGEGWSEPAEPGLVRAAFRDAAPELRALLEQAETWLAWPLQDLPARQLARGRVALLGDAAHAALPFAAQGAAMAIEDAAVLAAEVARDGEVGTALARYDRLRRSRTCRVQDAARRNARVYHAAFPVAAIRDAVMRRLGPDGMTARLDWLYGWNPARPG